MTSWSRMMRSYCHPRFQLYYSRPFFEPYSTDSYYRDDRPYTAEYPTLPSPLPYERSPPRSSPPLPLAAPAPAPPLAAGPSPSYLDFASKPSKTLPEPKRKLLILDLNGTLLLRSPRPPKPNRGQYQQSPPAQRRVLPRPYLTALRAYLFAPQTRAWLDVMVWSSAQPHSVDDMVLHTLGHDREWLVAVWARDTLGLAKDHYHRKVQTIKDLEKPWAALTPRLVRPASSTLVGRKLQPTYPSPKPAAHSAATTLLLDDSHDKAALQPHNHLCVPEYTRTQRNADLAVLQLERAVQQQQQEQHLSSVSHQENPSATRDATTNTNALERAVLSLPDGTGTGTGATTENDQARKRKRKKKKDSTQAQILQQQHQQFAAIATAAAGRASPALFDETLLAVIGILHAARLQSSVAGWLRTGALFSPRAPFSERAGAGASVMGNGDGDGDAKTWCDDPILVRAWACRGREAMHELGLKVEHGIQS